MNWNINDRVACMGLIFKLGIYDLREFFELYVVRWIKLSIKYIFISDFNVREYDIEYSRGIIKKADIISFSI